MRVLKSTKDFINVPQEIIDEHKNIVFEDDIDGEFMMIFGGDWFLVETKEDLKNVIEGDPYDIVEWKGDYLMVVLINNNSGGPCYFIPRNIVEGSSFANLETTN